MIKFEFGQHRARFSLDVWYFRISLHLDSGSQLAMVSYLFHISGFQGQGCLGVMLRVRFQISRVEPQRGSLWCHVQGQVPDFRGACCGVMSCSGLDSRFPDFQVSGSEGLPSFPGWVTVGHLQVHCCLLGSEEKLHTCLNFENVIIHSGSL